MKNNMFDRYRITMEDFIINYLDLGYMEGTMEFDNLLSCSHKDLTELGIPGIKRIRFEDVSLSDLMDGSILIVESGKGKNQLAPYVRPSIVLNSQNKTK